ncbi:hypothetical protein DPMN_011727 [Dreissena polymorpha]|uniref:Uncharacterized protein n=1 Tax=Dreissena polymorpha TaxID=45954 RepID=A0A9D4N4K9_DREPO|nr:hypothetical protein DPMN_011727 [Dreissena polymorpha]
MSSEIMFDHALSPVDVESVWSTVGPVFNEGVPPLFLIQSNVSSVLCTHPQRSVSKSHVPGPGHAPDRNATSSMAISPW